MNIRQPANPRDFTSYTTERIREGVPWCKICSPPERRT